MSFFKNEKNWPLKPLKKIATLKRGYDLPVQKRIPGNIPIFAANGVNGSHHEPMVKGPGVITGRSGTIGKVHYVEGDFWPLNTALYVENFHGNDPRWVMYMLQFFKLERFVRGAGVPTLNRNLVHDELIPLPPLPEQKRIAAILDKADQLRQKRQQAIALADDFLRSVFLDMFGDPVINPKGWDVKPLEKSIDNIVGGWSANGENEPAREGQLGVLKISSVTSGRFLPSENKVIDASAVGSRNLVFPQKGDLLFSRANTRELVAATVIVDADHDNIFLPDKLWNIRFDETSMLPEFFHYLLMHPRMKDRLTSQATGTSGSMLNISKKKLIETEAILPSIEKQRLFSSMYWSVGQTNKTLSESAVHTQELFNSISQKAFAGLL